MNKLLFVSALMSSTLLYSQEAASDVSVQKVSVDTTKTQVVESVNKESVLDSLKLMKNDSSVVATDSSIVKDSSATVVQPEVKTEVAPKQEVIELTDEEKEQIIKKELKEQQARNEVLKRKVEIINGLYLKSVERHLSSLKDILWEEIQYKIDIEKIKTSSILSSRMKNKKIVYTEKKLKKVYEDRDNVIDLIDQEAFNQFGAIVSKKMKSVSSLDGTEKVIEKMNLRLELMKVGQAMLLSTKAAVVNSKNVAIVDELIKDMEYRFTRKYEQLISTIK